MHMPRGRGAGVVTGLGCGGWVSGAALIKKKKKGDGGFGAEGGVVKLSITFPSGKQSRER